MPKTLEFIQNNKFRLSLIFLIIVYAVGTATVVAGFANDLMKLTPYNLLFVTILLLLNAERITISYILIFAAISIAGFLVEWLGTATGLVFGSYTYGSALGIAFRQVPMIIGLNWAMLVFSTAAIVDFLQLKKWLKAALMAVMMVCYDLLLEPVAIRFDFWQWEGGSIPLQNYLAWWVIGFIMSLAAQYRVAPLKNKLAPYIVVVQLFFFVLLLLNQ